MGSPYTPVDVISYNASPPPDDGSTAPANLVSWAGIKSKIGDPLKVAIEAVDDGMTAAVAKMIGGAGVLSTATDYTVLAADQSKLIKVTASGKIITTPAAATVGNPFLFAVLNLSTGDCTVDGNGSETVDGLGSIVIPSGKGCVVQTDGTNWFTWGQNFAQTPMVPQGYLTLVPTATSVLGLFPASDQSAKTAVYYRPDKGNLLPIPDGTNLIVYSFAELTLTLNGTNYVASNIYDVFAAISGGAVVIGTGPAWTTATAGSGARGSGAGTTELTKIKGLITNANAITLRNDTTTYSIAASAAVYLGSIFMDGTNGQVTCHASFGQSRKWGVWNAYNRRMISLKAGDSTASWTYATNTIRASNNDSNNKITVFTGLPECFYDVTFVQSTNNSYSNNTSTTTIGIGINVTNAYSGMQGANSSSSTTAGNNTMDLTASYKGIAMSIGINNVQCLEKTTSHGSTETYNGTETNMLLSVRYEG